MIAHTPGPWRVSGSDTVVGLKGNVVAECCGYSVHAKDPAQRAQGGRESNARLIAAAPELLAALRSLVVEVETIVANHAVRPPAAALDALASGQDSPLRAARHALAKAGGGGPPVIDTADDTPAWAAERRIQCHADGEGRWFAVPEGKTWGIQGPDGGGPEAALRRFRALNPDYDPPETPQAAPDPVAVLRRVLRWYRETTNGEMPAELHDDACRAVGEEVGG